MPINVRNIVVQPTFHDRPAQVILTVNPHDRYKSVAQQRWESPADRHRRLELERERAARARWEAKHSRYQKYTKYSDKSHDDYRYDNHHERHDYRRDR